MRRAVLSTACLFVTATLPAVAQRPSVDQLRTEVQREAVGLAGLTQEIVDMVFSFSELGFQENWTADYLTDILRREGFTIERGEADGPSSGS
jgi:aminobenzoyl-glutamate utilization protein B